MLHLYSRLRFFRFVLGIIVYGFNVLEPLLGREYTATPEGNRGEAAVGG